MPTKVTKRTLQGPKISTAAAIGLSENAVAIEPVLPTPDRSSVGMEMNGNDGSRSSSKASLEHNVTQTVAQGSDLDTQNPLDPRQAPASPEPTSKLEISYKIQTTEVLGRFEQRWIQGSLSKKNVAEFFNEISIYTSGREILKIKVHLSCRQEEFKETFTGLKDTIIRNDADRFEELKTDIHDALQEGLGIGATRYRIWLVPELAEPTVQEATKKAKARIDY